jgi:hypothetical protein
MARELLMYDDPLFTSIENCLAELIDQGLVTPEKVCCGCDRNARLVIYKQGENERIIFRCVNRTCRKKMSPFSISVHMPLNRYLFFIHLLFLDSSYNLIFQLVGVSSATIAKAKSSLRSYYQYKNSRNMLIGGPGVEVEVEVDETVLCRRGIIRNPTSNEDEVADTVWILGIVEKYDKSKFFVVRVPDRKIETITRVLESKIGVGSILVSDGHPSYPGVARNLGLTHLVVNHSVGFLNDDGDHTNGIENLWSQMKSIMSRQHGVKREDIDLWLEEFIFRKRNSLLDEGCPKNLLYDYIKFLNI